MDYSKVKINRIPKHVSELIKIVHELEADFPGRHFTIDGHLLGSIGEVMAAYHYGIDLYQASNETHDGIVDNKQVQIKISQQDRISISSKPEYLIVLYLRKDGTFYELYNGPGDCPWEMASDIKNHKGRYIRINQLMKLDKQVEPNCRIKQINYLEKMKPEYKN